MMFFSHSLFCFAQNSEAQDSTGITNYNTNIIWTKNIGDTLIHLTAGGNKIFASAADGKVFCFDLNGNLLWQYNSHKKIISSPLDYNGNLILAALSGDLISLNDSTGDVVQSIGLDEPLTAPLVNFGTNYNGQQTEAVLAGSSIGSIFCYDINSFEMLWENQSAKGEILSAPLEINHKIIYTSVDGFLYCVDSRSGMLIWKWSPEKDNKISFAECSPVSDGKSVFICTPAGSLFSIDLMLGTTNWENNSYNCYPSLSISENKEFLLLKSRNDYFYFVNTKNGRERKRLSLNYGEDNSIAQLLVFNGNVLFGTQIGNLYLIGKTFNWTMLFSTPNSQVQSLVYVADNTFAAVNSSGDLILFRLK